jgi:hypothetical protein
VTRPPSPRDGRWPSPGDGGGRLPATERSGWPGGREDDSWGPSTAVYSSAAAQAAPAPSGRSSRAFYPDAEAKPGKKSADWAAAGPRSAREQRAVRAADRRTERSVQALVERHETPERGLPWWGALLVLLGIAGLGGLIDTIGSIQVKSGFNIGIVVASVVAIFAVKRSHMFPVVIAPPIVYSGAALFQLYVRSSGLNDRRVVLDAAANYLVYGFPAIAAATAAVLIIAGFRLISRR